MKKWKTYWVPPGEGATVAQLAEACEVAEVTTWSKEAAFNLKALQIFGPAHKTNLALYPGKLRPYDLMRIALCK